MEATFSRKNINDKKEVIQVPDSIKGWLAYLMDKEKIFNQDWYKMMQFLFTISFIIWLAYLAKENNSLRDSNAKLIKTVHSISKQQQINNSSIPLVKDMTNWQIITLMNEVDSQFTSVANANTDVVQTGN